MDEEALTRARIRLEPFGDRFTPLYGNFAHLTGIFGEHGIDKIDGILADLGISTMQISSAQRGFSYLTSGPLSMQMDPRSDRNAAAVVNTYPEEKLWHLIRTYGEERYAKRIAQEIIKQRKTCKIETTDQLSAIVQKCIPRQNVIKSLARVYQAIRIEVNSELDNLKRMLPQATDLLKVGARIAIISYHSLEDRIVKTFFTEQEKPCICPPNLPQCVCGKQPRLKILARLVRPTAAEVNKNPAARSARLRIAEKISQ
jgi:16S rRNA (cytosine1402-N4)-methyltransferase